MTLYTFVGPCLGDVFAEPLLEGSTLLPPATRGDVQRLITEVQEPGIIALVDGYFDHALAISHAELCAALDRGWQVWGMSGMGAIRAYELRYEGMMGYGQIYQLFENHADFRDDEVLCVHDVEPPYSKQSEPLVHLRAAIQWLVQSEQLAETDGQRVISALSQMWFAERTMDTFLALLQEHGRSLPPSAIAHIHQNFSQFQLQNHDFQRFLQEQPWQQSELLSHRSVS